MHRGQLLEHVHAGEDGRDRRLCERLAGLLVAGQRGEIRLARILDAVDRRHQGLRVVGQQQPVAENRMGLFRSETPAGHAAVFGGLDAIRLTLLFRLVARDEQNEVVDIFQYLRVFRFDDQQRLLLRADGKRHAAARQFAQQPVQIGVEPLLEILDQVLGLDKVLFALAALVLGMRGHRLDHPRVEQPVQYSPRFMDLDHDVSVGRNRRGRRPGGRFGSRNRNQRSCQQGQDQQHSVPATASHLRCSSKKRRFMSRIVFRFSPPPAPCRWRRV